MRERITRTASALVDQVREQTDALRAKRQRSQLVHELGELCFRTHTGEDVPIEDVQDLVARISELQIAATTDTDRTDPLAATMNGKPNADPAESQQSKNTAAE